MLGASKEECFQKGQFFLCPEACGQERPGASMFLAQDAGPGESSHPQSCSTGLLCPEHRVLSKAGTGGPALPLLPGPRRRGGW